MTAKDIEGSIKKDPDAVLDYVINWTDWMATDDTISTSDWEITSDDEATPTLIEDSSTKVGLRTLIWLSGGTAGICYRVTNEIVTADGRTENRSFEIRVRDR